MGSFDLDYDELEDLPAEDLLAWALRTFGGRFAIATSLQKTGMVLIDMAARLGGGVRVVTLDTGRLPESTYAMMDTIRDRYGLRVEVALPDPLEVQAMVARHGANLFHQDPVLRKLCCQVRKVRPLERKLKAFRAYAVGLRRLTSEGRREIRKVDEAGGLMKISPLADWRRQDIESYIERHGVPVHPLYAEGYRSIGCAPCTRPVGAGNGERAGRWWWEKGGEKECGLHFEASGAIRRRLDLLIEEISQETYGIDGSGI